ncbi:hypothetical protein GCM10010464_27290 [Pseudonocardia yunnanensis]
MIRERDAELGRLTNHVRRFATMMTGLCGEDLEQWITGAEHDTLAPLASFTATCADAVGGWAMVVRVLRASAVRTGDRFGSRVGFGWRPAVRCCCWPSDPSTPMAVDRA